MAKEQGHKPIAQNRKARHDYAIVDTYEAGIALMGWGVAEDDVMTLDQMIERFNIDNLTPSPAAINFQKLEAVIRDDAIFASNTSTLPITSLAAEFKDPKRFIGIHFFSPVAVMMPSTSTCPPSRK